MVKRIKVDWDLRDRKSLIQSHNPKNGAKVLGIIQARMTSTRLPNKIYKDINGAPLLYHTIARARQAVLLDDLIVASPHPLPDVPDDVFNFVMQGDETDVLSRFVASIQGREADYIVRLTSDCPLLDPYLIDLVINEGLGHDYCSNVVYRSFPDGVDAEIMSRDMLNILDTVVREQHNREHVTSAIHGNPEWKDTFDIVSIESAKNYSDIKISIDTEDDLQFVRKIEGEINR